MSLAEGRSLLAVAAINLFQVVAALLERAVNVGKRICLDAEHEWRGDLFVVIVSACQAISTAKELEPVLSALHYSYQPTLFRFQVHARANNRFIC